MRKLLAMVAVLVYFLISSEGFVGGPFSDYNACWQYRQDHNASGACLSGWR